MKPHRPQARACNLVAALLLSLAGAPALAAAAQASASIYDLNFTLIDLAPDDGIAPELVFTRRFDWVMGTSGSGYVTQTDSAGNQVRDEDSYSHPFSSSAFLTPGSASASLDGARSDASSSVDAFQAQANATLPGTSSDLRRTATASVSAIAFYHPAGFLLSANTALLIQGRYNVFASVDPEEGSEMDRAWAHVTLDISFGPNDGGPIQHGLLSRFAQAGRSGDMPLNSGSSGDFAFRFTNESQTAMAGTFANRDAYADVSVNAVVPEPSTWALTLSAMVAAGILTTRRPSTRRQPPSMG